MEPKTQNVEGGAGVAVQRDCCAAPFIGFSARVEIATLAVRWCRENGCECNSHNIVSALNALGFLKASAAAGGDGGAQSQPEKKWCAWCGVWGDHTSGACDDLHDELLRRRAENEKPPNAAGEPRLPDHDSKND